MSNMASQPEIKALRKKVVLSLQKQGFIFDGDKISLPDDIDKEGIRHLHHEAVQTRIEGELADTIVRYLEQVSILYYKPHDWMPAFRIEVPKAIATNKHRLAIVLQGIKHQCATPSMLEPYPLYLADRTVKALARAIPAFRQVTTQRISEKYAGNIGEVFMAMHGYRTESGR